MHSASEPDLQRLHDHPDQRAPATDATIGKLDINGGAQINLDGADHAATTRASLFYQDRRADRRTTPVNKINGNSDSTIYGAFYFPQPAADRSTAPRA